MKWLLLIMVAVFLLGLIAVGGGFAWLMNVRTDVKDPQFAAKFQKTMEEVCVKRAKSYMGASLDYQQEALVKQVCSCDVKAGMNILKKKGAKTPLEMQKALTESRDQMDAAFQSCAAAYGLQ